MDQSDCYGLLHRRLVATGYYTGGWLLWVAIDKSDCYGVEYRSVVAMHKYGCFGLVRRGLVAMGSPTAFYDAC